jgi:hypothetical protein
MDIVNSSFAPPDDEVEFAEKSWPQNQHRHKKEGVIYG